MINYRYLNNSYINIFSGFFLDFTQKTWSLKVASPAGVKHKKIKLRFSLDRYFEETTKKTSTFQENIT